MEAKELMFQDEQKNSDAWAADFSQMIEAVSGKHLLNNFPLPTDKDQLHQLLKAGKYLFVPQELEINQPVLEEYFESLLIALGKILPDKSEDLDNLDRAYRSGQLPAQQILRATISNSWSELKIWSQNFSIDTNVLQFVSLSLVRPFRQQIAKSFLAHIDLGHWSKGFCPICGHWPVLGRLLDNGKKELWCCCCGTRWNFVRIGCNFCNNKNHDDLGFLTVDGYDKYRIYVCDKCKRYQKFLVCSEDQSGEEFDYDKEYLLSVELDQAAIGAGFVAEPVGMVSTAN